MPTDAKAGCLYPNNARGLREAQAEGFDNALVCDMLGNVAETATSNIFLAKDGVVRTPAAERHLPQRHHPPARHRSPARGRRPWSRRRPCATRTSRRRDEIFSSGNYSKVVPAIRIDERNLQPGPVFRKARELYWDFAHSRAAEAA